MRAGQKKEDGSDTWPVKSIKSMHELLQDTGSMCGYAGEEEEGVVAITTTIRNPMINE